MFKWHSDVTRAITIPCRSKYPANAISRSSNTVNVINILSRKALALLPFYFNVKMCMKIKVIDTLLVVDLLR